MGPRGEGYVIIQLLLFGLIAFGPEQLSFLPTITPSMQQWLTPLGYVLALMGVLLIGAGVVHLGANLTPYPHPKPQSNLVESGAYRIVRHPIYSGLVIGALGWSLLKASVPMVVYSLLLFLFFDIKSRQEERWLSEKFANYERYQQRVRKLVPFVY